jgi:hypothetical protein
MIPVVIVPKDIYDGLVAAMKADGYVSRYISIDEINCHNFILRRAT